METNQSSRGDVHKSASPHITIGIPTFNRANKLDRLLRWLEVELNAGGLLEQVVVLVANNASQDDTAAVLESATSRGFHFIHYTHPENCEFDRNLLSLYQRTTTPYLWYMGDDDLPLPGAICAVLTLVGDHSPDVLLAPFIQPPGSWRSETEPPEPYRILSEARAAIGSVDAHWKLTSYVVRVFPLNADQLEELSRHCGPRWMFMAIALTVLGTAGMPRLLTMSKPIATSDGDFHLVAFTPDAIFNNAKTFDHSFVVRHFPELREARARSSYRQVIQFLWQGQTGALTAADPAKWDLFGKGLAWNWSQLSAHPQIALQLILVKTRTGYLFRGGILGSAFSAWTRLLHYGSRAGWLSGVRQVRRRLRDNNRQKNLAVAANSGKSGPGSGTA